MGVTIHFSGRLKDSKSYPLFIGELQDYAETRDWPWTEISKSHTTLTRIQDEELHNYTGPSFGIQISPHPDAEPLCFEFDENYFVQGFIKTQFAGVDTHIAVVDLLLYVMPFFEELVVGDEGEYWETRDGSITASHFQKINDALDDLQS